MTPFESALLAMLAPLAVAVTAWIRAEIAIKQGKAAAAKQDKQP